MKIQWTPSLRVKEALAICGSLSNPGKMPCHGYALPAQRCRLGSFLQQLPKAICHYCYALRGRYVFRKVQAAMERRIESLSNPRWVDAITTLIHRSTDRYFRWHDSGDLQNLEHLEKIIQVCKNLPRVKFWLPTREYQTVEAYRRLGGQIPSNLCIRLSAHLIDGKLPLVYGLPVSTVSTQNAGIRSNTHICPAPKQNNQCGNCRACWDRSVKVVTYHLKWASPEFSRGKQ
jgi:Gene product 88